MHKLCLLVLIQPHLDFFVGRDQYGDGLQRLAQGRAQQALTCINVELSAVCSADDARRVVIQVGILAPGHRCALVWADVSVGF